MSSVNQSDSPLPDGLRLSAFDALRAPNATPASTMNSLHSDPPNEGTPLNTQEERLRDGRPLWNKLYSPYLLLENSGSVARDHLASERTFLAYVRTSLAMASAGVALVQLFSVSASTPNVSEQIKARLPRFARPLGAVIVATSIFILLVGITRYFRIQALLIKGKFPPARHITIVISALLAVLMSVVFGILAGVTD